MSDFQSFRNAVLENDDLQDEVMSVVMTATTNGSGLGDGIATLGMKHNYFFTSEEVYSHADFLGQDGDLTDFELELISGVSIKVRPVNPFIPTVSPNRLL
tara:strand:+ start:95 stop:394 length:300 start_codon:yes stop_codon:yes gene_type:complete